MSSPQKCWPFSRNRKETRQALHDRTMELMGAEICAQKAQSEEAILAILDAEQTELFLQMKEERQFRANDKTRTRKGRDGPGLLRIRGRRLLKFREPLTDGAWTIRLFSGHDNGPDRRRQPFDREGPVQRVERLFQ